MKQSQLCWHAFWLAPLRSSSLVAVCDLVKCIKGTCVGSSSFPYYACECDSGWKPLFGSSSFPCVLPNCSISTNCANTSASPASAPPPVVSPTNLVSVCSLPVCGNGQCIQNSTGNSSSYGYECNCDVGYSNLLNKTDGFCIRECSLGADCTNLNIGGSLLPPPPPPPPQSSSQNSNQGPKQLSLQSNLVMMATLALMALYD